LRPVTVGLAAGDRALVKMSEDSRHLARLLGNSPDMQLPQTRVLVQVSLGLPPAASLHGAPPTEVCSSTGGE